MRRTLWPMVAGALAAALLTLPPGRLGAQQRPAAQADTRPGLAILDFDVGATIGMPAEDYQALRRGLAGMTISELAANPAIRVVERHQMQQILQELQLARGEQVDPQTALRAARLVNARYMVTGTLYDVRGNFRIDARLFDVETSQIIRTQRVSGRLDNVYDLVQQLAQALMRDANLPPLPRQVQQEREERGQPPSPAVLAYSRGMLYADRGDKERAVEQYRRAISAFPNYTEALAECNRLQTGACS